MFLSWPSSAADDARKQTDILYGVRSPRHGCQIAWISEPSECGVIHPARIEAEAESLVISKFPGITPKISPIIRNLDRINVES
jgi:hypothetical protein